MKATPDDKQGMNCAESTKEQYSLSDIYGYMDSQQQRPWKLQHRRCEHCLIERQYAWIHQCLHSWQPGHF